MISGTSVSSILTAALSLPERYGSTEPRYYSSDVIDFYEEKSAYIYYNED